MPQFASRAARVSAVRSRRRGTPPRSTGPVRMPPRCREHPSGSTSRVIRPWARRWRGRRAPAAWPTGSPPSGGGRLRATRTAGRAHRHLPAYRRAAGRRGAGDGPPARAAHGPAKRRRPALSRDCRLHPDHGPLPVRGRCADLRGRRVHADGLPAAAPPAGADPARRAVADPRGPGADGAAVPTLVLHDAEGATLARLAAVYQRRRRRIPGSRNAPTGRAMRRALVLLFALLTGWSPGARRPRRTGPRRTGPAHGTPAGGTAAHGSCSNGRARASRGSVRSVPAGPGRRRSGESGAARRFRQGARPAGADGSARRRRRTGSPARWCRAARLPRQGQGTARRPPATASPSSSIRRDSSAARGVENRASSR